MFIAGFNAPTESGAILDCLSGTRNALLISCAEDISGLKPSGAKYPVFDSVIGFAGFDSD